MSVKPRVAVVGAGPVGLALAAELRLGGAPVTVLERRERRSTESRASTLHARTMELFDQRGLVSVLGSPPNDRMGHFGGLPLDLGEQPTSYPGQWKVPQTRVEEILADRARQLGADIRRRHEVFAVGDLGDSVAVEFETGDGNGVLTVDYVVGCDGEDSVVRSLAGFEMAGRAATRQMLRADIRGITVASRRFERFPRGLAIAARRPDGVTRVMVHEFDGPALADGAEPNFATVVGAWQRVVGEDISAGEPIWLNAFGNASRQATTYRRGRVLLAGDAAHQQMPVGGQALNLGLQDAFNLGWKLARAATPEAPPGLLESYHDERHGVGRRVLDNIEAQALLLLGGPGVEAARDVVGELLQYSPARSHLADTITGLGVRYDLGDGPLVGCRLPHLDVSLDPGRSSTTELLRSGRGLLLDLSADRARAATLAEIARGWTPPVEVASLSAGPPAPADIPDTVLVRPDGYVAWTGSRDADPRPALTRWFGKHAG